MSANVGFVQVQREVRGVGLDLGGPSKVRAWLELQMEARWALGLSDNGVLLQVASSEASDRWVMARNGWPLGDPAGSWPAW